MNEELQTFEPPFLESTTTSFKSLSKKRPLTEINNNNVPSDESQQLSLDFSMSLSKKRRNSLSEQFQLFETSSNTNTESTQSVEQVSSPDYETYRQLILAEERSRLPVVEPPPKIAISDTPTFQKKQPIVRKTFDQPCQHSGCGEMSNYKNRTLCHKHYMKELRQERESDDRNPYKTTRTTYSDVVTEELAAYYKEETPHIPLLSIIHGTCRIQGCTTKHRARGLCQKHYVAAQRAEKKLSSKK